MAHQTNLSTWKAEPVADKKPEVYFIPAKWKNEIDVFKCLSCGHFENIKDDMIMHVLKHVPEDKREKVFEELTRSK